MKPEKITLAGEYKIGRGNTLHNTKTGLIVHIRERNKTTTSNKPKYFLAIHKPTYEYISSIYPKTSAISSSDGNVKVFEFDYKKTKHTLNIDNNLAVIEQAGGAK